MDIKKYSNLIVSTKIYLILILSFFKIINPHGFGGNTLVQEATGSFWQIENIVEYISNGQNLYVFSYDELVNDFIPKKIKTVGFSESEYHCRLFCNQDISPIKCTPLQLFYSVTNQS